MENQKITTNKESMNTSNTNTFGKNLKLLRSVYKFTQKDISIKMGIVPQQYQKYESGESNIPLQRLQSLASLYNITLSDLAGVYDGTHSLYIEFSPNNDAIVNIKKI